MVARYLGVVEAAGSSPVTQTISSIHKGFDFMNTRFFYLNMVIWFCQKLVPIGHETVFSLVYL